MNWQILTTTGVTITSGGTNWDVVRGYVACLDKSWAEHPDGTSDYILIYLDFEYDEGNNPCSMNTFNEGDIGLYLISPTPRTTNDVCIPTGTYTAFGVREGLAQQGNEPNEDVGDCTDYDACVNGSGEGICIDSVGAISVSELP